MALSIWTYFIDRKNTHTAPVSTRAKSSEVFVKPTARSNLTVHSRPKPSQVFLLPAKVSIASGRSTRSSGLFCIIWRLCKKPSQASVNSVPPRSREESDDEEPEVSDSRSRKNSDSNAVQLLANDQTESSVPVMATTQNQVQNSNNNSVLQQFAPFAPRDSRQLVKDRDSMGSDSDSDSDSDFSLASQVSDDDPDQEPWVRPAVIIRTVLSSQKIQQAQCAEWLKQKPHGTACEPAWLEYLARYERKRGTDLDSYCAAIRKGFPELEREMMEKLRAIDDRLGFCREHADSGRKRLGKIKLSVNAKELGSKDVKADGSER